MTDGRYDRLQAMRWWDSAAVAGARALVVGCGALGNEVVKNLLLLGWGEIVLVDFDRIELSNLTRSIFFRESDIGQEKTAVLERRGREINPDCRLIGLAGDVRLKVSSGLVSRLDVVFGCLDNVAARLSLNQMAGQAGRPFIDGGLSEWGGTVSLYCPGSGACYACGLTSDDFGELNLRRSCPAYAAKALEAKGTPTTPTVSSIIAAQMVQFGLKWIHGRRNPPDFPVSSQIRFDTAYDRYWKMRLPYNSECYAHPDSPVVRTDELICQTSKWSVIVDRCRALLGTDQIAIQLPVPILKSWSCINCHESATVNSAWLNDRQFLCTSCHRPTVPELCNQIIGVENFLDFSPSEMSFPDWTWLSACTASEEIVFELQSPAQPAPSRTNQESP